MMIDYIELLVGEVLLGDVTNTYLYVGEDLEAQQIALGCFIRRVQEEEQQLTLVDCSSGRVIVNDTQRFFFVHRSRYECAVIGMSFNRIFIDVNKSAMRDHVRRNLSPHLVYHGGDFV